jgi:hypothetical protein
LKNIFEGMDFTWKRVQGGEKIGKQISKIISEFDAENPKNSIQNFFTLNDLSNQLKINLQPYQTNIFDNILSSLHGYFHETVSKDFQLSITDSIEYNVLSIDRMNSVNIVKDTVKTSIKKISELYWISKPIEHNMFNIKKEFLTNEPMLTYSEIASSIHFNNDNIISLQTNKHHGYYLTNYEAFKRHFIQYKWVDPEKGELYRPLVITPPVMINLTQKSFVFADLKPKEIQVIVKAGKDNVKGVLILKSDSKLNEHKIISEDKNDHKVALAELTTFNYSPVSYNFELAKKGDEKIFTFQFRAPVASNVTLSEVEGSTTINFTAEVDGIIYSKGIKEIKYDHIPVQTWFPEAEAKLVKVAIKKTFNTVGYIQGAGDAVPASLEQMGYKVVMITDEQLQNGNLNEFPAIVLGVRAFNTNEKLQQYKQRVFDYVKEGGNLIVQYNTNSFFGPLKDQISPVPFKISRDRVTIEEAPVTFLLPEHPVLNFPNKITNTDFDGWIQERGIYFGTEMDSSFECPLSMNDPGEKPNKGSLIIAKYGKGNYVYTGLAFFRELPAGVPGAYRLIANILSLETDKKFK